MTRLNPANMPSKPFLSFFFPFPSFLQLGYSDSFRDRRCKHCISKWFFWGGGLKREMGSCGGAEEPSVKSQQRAEPLDNYSTEEAVTLLKLRSHSAKSEGPRWPLQQVTMWMYVGGGVGLAGHGAPLSAWADGPAQFDHTSTTVVQKVALSVALRVNNASVTRQGGTWSETRKTPECLVHPPPSPSHTSLGALQGNNHQVGTCWSIQAWPHHQGP